MHVPIPDLFGEVVASDAAEQSRATMWDAPALRRAPPLQYRDSGQLGALASPSLRYATAKVVKATCGDGAAGRLTSLGSTTNHSSCTRIMSGCTGGDWRWGLWPPPFQRKAN